MPAKKPQSTPLPKTATKSPSAFVNKYGFKISPTSAASALDMLRRYIEERAAILRPDSAVKIKETADAVRMMDALFKFKEELADAVKSPAEKAYDTLRFSIIPNLMDDEGLTQIGVEGIGRTNLQDDVQCKVESPEKLMGWLIEEGFEDMIKETVNAQTLAAFVRRRTKAAESLPPPEVLVVKPIVRAVITRG